MTIGELKTYIYKENKIEYVLQEIGCHHIVYHQNKEYYSCGNVDGDNKSCVIVRNNEYLNVVNYTRENFLMTDQTLLHSFSITCQQNIKILLRGKL